MFKQKKVWQLTSSPPAFHAFAPFYPLHCSLCLLAINSFTTSFQPLLYFPALPLTLLCPPQVLDDGSVSDTFTHKSLFPEDMDPLSLCGTLHADGTLVVSVRRASASGGQEALAGPTYRSEAYL